MVYGANVFWAAGDFFSVQYHKWPLEEIVSKAECDDTSSLHTSMVTQHFHKSLCHNKFHARALRLNSFHIHTDYLHLSKGGDCRL